MDTLSPKRASAIVVPTARIEDVLRSRDAVVVDLRSPAEHAEDHLPGAANVPLFDDVERALVGTLYKQVSPEAAFEAGREITRRKITDLVGEIARLAGLDLATKDLELRVEALTGGGIGGLARSIVTEPSDDPLEAPIVVHCWRGGLRSQSVAALLVSLGLQRVVHLQGGYKAYRAEVLRELSTFAAPTTFVLRGLTGVGKTLVLKEVERLRPGWTLDLEALAGHRSSLLGMVGLEPRSQKAFESGIAASLRSRSDAPLVLEGESRKVGDAFIPAAIWRALAGGMNLELVADVERRTQVLKEDYLSAPDSVAGLARQLPLIEARMDLRPDEPHLVDLLHAGRIDELVHLLLDRYYDPLYRHGERGRRVAWKIDAQDPARAACEVVAWIERRREGRSPEAG